MSCMLSLKTVAKKKKEKLDFTYLRRCHSLAEEPTEKKKVLRLYSKQSSL